MPFAVAARGNEIEACVFVVFTVPMIGVVVVVVRSVENVHPPAPAVPSSAMPAVTVTVGASPMSTVSVPLSSVRYALPSGPSHTSAFTVASGPGFVTVAGAVAEQLDGAITKSNTSLYSSGEAPEPQLHSITARHDITARRRGRMPPVYHAIEPAMRGVEQIPLLYDSMCALMEATGLKAWRLWLVRGAKGGVLDIGCGTGRNLPLYAQDTFVVGLDPSADALAKAKRRAPHVPLVRASAEALPFRAGAFDTVVSGLVFCSVPDAAKGLGEVKRALKRGGALRMLEHVRSHVPWRARLQDWVQPAWTAVAGGCHPNRATESAVEAAGFTIEEDGRRTEGNMRRFSARPTG